MQRKRSGINTGIWIVEGWQRDWEPWFYPASKVYITDQLERSASGPGSHSAIFQSLGSTSDNSRVQRCPAKIFIPRRNKVRTRYLWCTCTWADVPALTVWDDLWYAWMSHLLHPLADGHLLLGRTRRPHGTETHRIPL
jgi:hypothetical protein